MQIYHTPLLVQGVCFSPPYAKPPPARSLSPPRPCLQIGGEIMRGLFYSGATGSGSGPGLDFRSRFSCAHGMCNMTGVKLGPIYTPVPNRWIKPNYVITAAAGNWAVRECMTDYYCVVRPVPTGPTCCLSVCLSVCLSAGPSVQKYIPTCSQPSRPVHALRWWRIRDRPR